MALDGGTVILRLGLDEAKGRGGRLLIPFLIIKINLMKRIRKSLHLVLLFSIFTGVQMSCIGMRRVHGGRGLWDQLWLTSL